ncbi:MAG: hypothetical protein ACRCX1_02785 [Bacteroidales bacterium]
MNILRYIERIQLLHKLITEERTGNPDTLSQRLDISRASLYNLIDELKSIDAPISYSRTKETFFYYKAFSLDIYFKVETLEHDDLKKISGGSEKLSLRLLF